MLYILADHQDITCYGIMKLTRQLDATATFAEAGHLRDVTRRLMLDGTDTPAVLIIDYTLLSCTEDDLQIMHDRFPRLHFVLFSDQLSRTFLRRRVYTSHRFSVVLKDSTLTEIETCLREAAAGHQYVCRRVADALDDDSTATAMPSPLSATEREVLAALALGKTTKDIAAERHLSAYTVMTHRKNIFRKLAVNNVQEAIRYAVRAGVVNPVEYYI